MSEARTSELVRGLTWAESITWGECPVCHAPHGEKCNPNVGLRIGHCQDESQHVHLGRLNAAPKLVRMVPCG